MTVAKLYPELYAMVGSIRKKWGELGYECIAGKKGPAITRLMTNLMRWILANRRHLDISKIPDEEMKEDFPIETTHLYYLPLGSFEAHGHMNYKIDRVSEDDINNAKATDNDVLRLFGIVALSQNRDILLSLGAGKAFKRAEVDGGLPWKNQIFYTLSCQFNDPDLHLDPPERATFLNSFCDLNPNHFDSISSNRDYEFLKKLWAKTLKEYNAAMKLWKLGTGGGSGAPENYCDWETRDGEYFATYGDDKVKGKYYLAWIYMLDQQTNYAFDTVNDPAPDDTVTEDSIGGGSGVMKGKKGQQLGTAIEKFGERMSVRPSRGRWCHIIGRSQSRVIARILVRGVGVVLAM